MALERRRTGRGLPPAFLLLLLPAWAAALWTLDPVLLGYRDLHPRFWAWVRTETALAAAGLLLWLALRSRLGPWLADRRRTAAFALLACVTPGVLRLAVPFRPPIDWRESGRRLGYDLDAVIAAAGELVRRIVAEVPPEGRIAVVHGLPDADRPERFRPEVPFFLFHALAPRLCYFHREDPPREELAREGIGWRLDLRGSSPRTGYGGAVLERLPP